MNQLHILRYYYKAKQSVYSNGYFYEIYWQERQNIDSINLQSFFSEYSWVVLSSGMRESVIKKKFSELSNVFNNWNDPIAISKKNVAIRNKALKIFNNAPKIDAILFMAKYLCSTTVKNEIELISTLGCAYLEKFPFLGPATSLHFAKNLGFVVSKPDRHIVRISEKFGYNCPAKFCTEISQHTGEKVSVVDIILWRYATLDKNYLDKIC
jgi:hypothetical protein